MSKVILVSAGHTNLPHQDQGDIAGKYIEGVETLKLRDRVATILRMGGHSVLEDGADGISEPLIKAIALARIAGIAVEIHFNAGPAAAHGVEVLSKEGHKQLAQLLAKAVADSAGFTLRGDAGWKSDTSGAHSRLGFCGAGGLILEVCFLTNPDEMAAYVAHFEDIAQAIANVLAIAAH